ncbi:MAG: DivIVA domain-containing protein [Actinomycetota bacterium]|nr:DivIVA domain-containing protein [Actinomycetota bacterium]
MSAWVAVGVAVGVAYVGVVVALLTGGRASRRGPQPPDWLVPTPVEVSRLRFPLAWRGYDPEHVDVHLDALAAAYEELYAAAGPSVVARARQRLAVRLDVDDRSP